MAREDALDQALALLGNRDLRHRYRGMPLPHGVAALLAVVGGEPERLRQAATDRAAVARAGQASARAAAEQDYQAANRLQQERTGGDACAAAEAVIDQELGL